MSHVLIYISHWIPELSFCRVEISNATRAVAMHAGAWSVSAPLRYAGMVINGADMNTR